MRQVLYEGTITQKVGNDILEKKVLYINILEIEYFEENNFLKFIETVSYYHFSKWAVVNLITYDMFLELAIGYALSMIEPFDNQEPWSEEEYNDFIEQIKSLSLNDYVLFMCEKATI